MARTTILLALIAAPLARADEAGLEAHLARLVARVRVTAADFDLTTAKGQEAFQKAEVQASEAGGELAAILSKHPEAWTAVRPALRDLPRDETRRDLKLRLIEILACDDDRDSTKLLDAELATNARGVPVSALIRMDRHGSPAAAKELAKLVAREPGFANLEAAIHLGLRGDAAAKPVLAWALECGAGTRNFDRMSYGVALACQRLGDDEPWRAMRRRAGAEVARALKQDDFATARWFALQLEFFAGVAARADRVDVPDLDDACASHVARRIPDVRTVEDLHDLLRHLRPA